MRDNALYLCIPHDADGKSIVSDRKDAARDARNSNWKLSRMAIRSERVQGDLCIRAVRIMQSTGWLGVRPGRWVYDAAKTVLIRCRHSCGSKILGTAVDSCHSASSARPRDMAATIRIATFERYLCTLQRHVERCCNAWHIHQ